jgi:methionine sulfoxide reductase heme-binding subunit
MIAVLVTSLLRKRIGYRAWRATHWLAYGSWPVAIAHSLGMGTDRGSGWMLAIVVGCAVLVGLALIARLTDPGAGRPMPATAPTRTPRARPTPAVARR